MEKIGFVFMTIIFALGFLFLFAFVIKPWFIQTLCENLVKC